MKLRSLSFLALFIALISFAPFESEARRKPKCTCGAKHQLEELREIVEHWTSGVERQPVGDSIDAVERETNVLYSGVEDQWGYIKEFIGILITEIEAD